jgi:tetratricopeptide (TPR) repeat protein
MSVAGPPAWLWPALIVVAAMAYLPAMNAPFLFDDLTSPVLSPEGSPPLMELLKSSRPLYYASLWLDRQMFGLSPAPMHFVSLLLHLLNACLMLGVLKKLCGLAGVDESKRGWVATAGAGIFLLHPALTEAVSYIASRGEVLSLFFALAAYRVFLGAERIGVGRAMAVVLLFGLAAGSKEHSFALLGVMVLTAVWFGQGVADGLKARAMVFVPLIVGGVAGAVYVFKAVGTQATAGFGVEGVTPLTYLATQCEVVWRYVLMFVLPRGMNIDHAVPFAKSWAEPLTIAGAVAGVAATVAAIRYRREWALAGFGWLAFVMLLAPTSSVIPIADAMADRRLYFSSLGLVAVAVELMRRTKLPDVKTLGALAGVMAVLGGLTWSRNQDYTSAERMWRSSVEANPRNSRAHFQLAHAMYAQGACAESAAQYGEAHKLGQTGSDLLVDWALALDCAGQAGEAEAKLKEAVAAGKRSYHARSTLGMVLAKQGKLEAALEELNAAIRINGRFDMTWAYRGNVLFMLGRREAAASDFRRALELNPENPVAQKGLAAALAR